ncbi:MAG: septal ring lytic transglycosylase RlpA family protein [Aliivibrio sp.]|uniref:septal ring lytic transglycosylase RlpA family protein n=1 Tax=Aliivibrio sp. TaxID=1872443 RepID=UPI001A645625|nr:septal ring lytic transglycosylase RlpA family protein [Aliivibrio sp.]
MRLLLIIITFMLTACGTTTPVNNNDDPNAGRYSLKHDIAPEHTDVPKFTTEDAVPIYEQKSLYGNKDYRLRGIDYTIEKKPKGFTEEGVTSWYGRKFHGHATSNGEVYDMYKMTAAHKTLPIPSYIKVTNQDNGKVAIVRVNDRGPFHQGRITDLSYAAASKLGVLQTGTAKVKIEVITVKKPDNVEDWLPPFPDYYYIQVAAGKNIESSRTLAKNLGQTFLAPTDIKEVNSIFRIRLGPFIEHEQATKLLKKVRSTSYKTAFISQEKQLNKSE